MIKYLVKEEMTEKYSEIDTHETDWAQLSQEEQDTCALLSVSGWTTGIGAEDMLPLAIDQAIVEQLVQKGFIQKRSAAEYAQEYIDAHADKFNELKVRRMEAVEIIPPPPLTKEERAFIYDYESFVRVAGNPKSPIRYRLKSQAFHNFAKTKLT